MNQPGTLTFTAWIWDAEAHRKVRPTTHLCGSIVAAKGWLFERIAAEPDALEYGIDEKRGGHIETVFQSAAIAERIKKTAMDRCVICGARNPTLLDKDHGALCEECGEDLDAGRELIDAINDLHEAINGEPEDYD